MNVIDEEQTYIFRQVVVDRLAKLKDIYKKIGGYERISIARDIEKAERDIKGIDDLIREAQEKD